MKVRFKKTLVIGASENPARYANMAIHLLSSMGHKVVAIGKRKGIVEDVEIDTDFPEYHEIDTVTLYINSGLQKNYYNYILSLKPKRIIFNPGAENPELTKLAKQNNIDTEDACTLVLLRTNQY